MPWLLHSSRTFSKYLPFPSAVSWRNTTRTLVSGDPCLNVSSQRTNPWPYALSLQILSTEKELFSPSSKSLRPIFPVPYVTSLPYSGNRSPPVMKYQGNVQRQGAILDPTLLTTVFKRYTLYCVSNSQSCQSLHKIILIELNVTKIPTSPQSNRRHFEWNYLKPNI